MPEIWKLIANTRYEISNYGRIRKYVGGTVNKVGYRFIHWPGRRQPIAVHVLVAQEFLGKRPDGQVINHKDGNKLNNHVDNLEYVKHVENVRQGKAAKLTRQDVLDIRKLFKKGWNQTQISKMYPVGAHQIWAIVRRKAWRDMK